VQSPLRETAHCLNSSQAQPQPYSLAITLPAAPVAVPTVALAVTQTLRGTQSRLAAAQLALKFGAGAEGGVIKGAGGGGGEDPILQ